MRVLQLVPALGADRVGGVGGYAERLGEALESRGIASSLLASPPGESPGPEQLSARTPAALAEALDRWWDGSGAGVLLHYANYGYQERGCPVWLVEGIRRWAALGDGRRVATFFHEVNAFGPPWRSSFWLSPLQRRLAAALAGMSAGLATSLELYREVLARWVPRRRIEVLPVFSAVGEPAEVPPLASRQRRLVILGGPGTRRRAFREPADLAAACRALGVEEVLDIGPLPGEAPDLPPAEIAGLPVRRCGVLPADEVSRLLLGARAGYLAYPPGFLPKSTVFAAYCAHGVVPVCAWPHPHGGGPPRAGEHYLTPRPASPLSEADLAALAARARAWYGEHSLARQAPTLADLIFGSAAAA